MIDFPITKSNSTNYFIGEIELGNMKKPFGLIAQLFISHTDIVLLIEGCSMFGETVEEGI